VTPERWAQIEEVFHRAAEADPRHRVSILEQACGEDQELRKQVEALLSADHEAGGKMQAAVLSEIAAAAFSQVGQTISHYRILSGIDSGGMGLVYRAEDLNLGRRVAIKFLPQELVNDPVAIQRFEREAHSASALEHPNICPIYEFGEYQGQPFLVMQLLEGCTLRELITSPESAKPPFDGAQVIDIAVGILDGLSAAHRHGIVHRDIKPANIFVTKSGEVKILDFGLAKLEHMDKGQSEYPIVDPLTLDLSLSQTGTRIGTAGYMSPEQIRGERIDARSDIFSFGLVLYEMATGQRAIQGEVFSELQEGVLSRTVEMPEAVRPKIPPRLDKVIKKCIQKDLPRRYQTVSDIRTDLLQLKLRKRMSRMQSWLAAAVLFILAVLGFWIARRYASPVQRPELKVRQLTANSSENNVYGGLISPDGRYLVYSDHRGLHLKVIESGETHTIPRPAELAATLEWKCATWSPDSSRFLANSSPPLNDPGEISDSDVSIWSIPVFSVIPRKLRNRAFAWSFSPDGSLIAFGTNGGPHGPREIWLMDSNGDRAHKQFESGNDDTIGSAGWAADGKRLIYARDRGAEVALYSQDLVGGPPVLLERSVELSNRNIDFGITFPDGRTIFSVTEQAGTAATNTCNFWEVRNDLRTGKLIERPRQLTNWAGFCMDPTSVTSDGKKLAFVQMAGHPSVYAADFGADGIHITNERHVTLSESMDVVADWAPDGKSIIFFSNRNGHAGIYRQGLEDDNAEPLLTTEQAVSVCCVTPDRKSFLYLTTPRSAQPTDGSDVMQLSLAKNISQKLFSARNVEGWGCAEPGSKLCVIAERSNDGRYALVTGFDVEKGRGSEITRIALDPKTTNWAFALSPEGRRFAVIRRPGAVLQILKMNGSVLQEIKVAGWANSAPIHWTRNGKALYVPLTTGAGSQLLRVDLRGKIQLVRNNFGGDYTYGIPSPDQRRLAIQSTADSRNIWLMENF
jgi:eukaryotic-like serine/threonine-protein kinase